MFFPPPGGAMEYIAYRSVRYMDFVRSTSSSRVCHHTSRAQFSSHVLVLTSSSISPWIPSGGRWMGQSPLVMWSAVCSAPQSQQALVESPQRSIFAPNLPTPVRSLFSRVQARRDRPTPVRCLMVWARICAVSWWWMPTSQPTLLVSSVSPSLVERQRPPVVEHGG